MHREGEEMEKAEITRLVSGLTSIQSHFDTMKIYMPQIAKLVFFISEIVPLLNMIHDNLHQTNSLMPAAAEKLGKVTDATELAATEVMDIVDNVIKRLNTMTASVDAIEGAGNNPGTVMENAGIIRREIDGSQDDLFSILNALQFQDITTQQINGIMSTIDTVNVKINELLNGFDEDSLGAKSLRNVAFDPNAEFDFNRSRESQAMVDTIIREGTGQKTGEPAGAETADNQADTDKQDETAPGQEAGTGQDRSGDSAGKIADKIVFGKDGQPDISSILGKINSLKDR